MKKVRVRFYDDDLSIQIPSAHLRDILVSIDGDAYIKYEDEDSEPIRILGTYENVLHQIEVIERS